MGWGDVLADIAPTLIGGKAGAGISFIGNLLGMKENSDREDAGKSAYYQALAQQKAAGEIANQVNQQRAAWEQALRTSAVGQNSELTNTLKQAQIAMGAMPQFNQGTLNADYSQTKGYMMNDFMDALKLVESQGRSNQIERLGGATSNTADNDRLRSLMKQYTPELAKIDRSAMDQAIARQTGTMGLFNQNRVNTLSEINSIYEPVIKNTTSLIPNSDPQSAMYSATINTNAARDELKATDDNSSDYAAMIAKAFSGLSGGKTLSDWIRLE